VAVFKLNQIVLEVFAGHMDVRATNRVLDAAPEALNCRSFDLI